MSEAAPRTSTDDLVARIAQLESALFAERAAHTASQALVDQLRKECDHLRASHDRLRQDLELLRRRIFIAKAERIDSTQLELEFAEKLSALDALSKQLSEDTAPGEVKAAGRGGPNGKKKPSGRRDLRKANIPEVRVEIADPIFDELVEAGKAVRIGFEESCKLAWQRGGHRRLVIARVTYRTFDSEGNATFGTAEMPAETFPRSLAAPSMLAHIISEKHCKGLPLYRIEDGFRRDGMPVDRGTMCRWLEDAGATAGATVIAAAHKEALATAFCLSTDATGVSIQPIPTGDKKRQPCRRGHFFVQIADRDHVFFEYVPKETSEAVAEMFRGFKGYVQADAKSVFNILYRPPPADGKSDSANADSCVAIEVGCLAHARRKFWEAAVAGKTAVAREAVYRIGRIYALEDTWRDKTSDEITRLRNIHSRPQVEAFFAWAESEYERVRSARGLLRTALGYAVRQKDALMRFLDDGRLRLDNNQSERELRRIAVGRKAWLFAGSDDHAASAGHFLSLVASARLHGLDPEAYLRDLFRILGHWPAHRYIELAPKYWATTRARLDPAQLVAEIGPLTVPDHLTPSAEQKTATG